MHCYCCYNQILFNSSRQNGASNDEEIAEADENMEKEVEAMKHDWIHPCVTGDEWRHRWDYKRTIWRKIEHLRKCFAGTTFITVFILSPMKITTVWINFKLFFAFCRLHQPPPSTTPNQQGFFFSWFILQLIHQSSMSFCLISGRIGLHSTFDDKNICMIIIVSLIVTRHCEINFLSNNSDQGFYRFLQKICDRAMSGRKYICDHVFPNEC